MSAAPYQNLTVLFLPRWYPHRYDPMPGLFIQRQAEALAATHHVVVLYVHPDPDCPGEFEIDYSVERGIIVVRIYYKIPEIKIPGIFQVMNLITFYRAHIRGLEVIGDFSPDIIHSHILTREAVVGHILSRRYHVPHVISEHWSRYFPENGSYRGLFRKLVTRYVTGKAAAIITVSEVLKKAMVSCNLMNNLYFVVPNVVDSTPFKGLPEKKASSLKQFMHVSCFDDRAKNITGLLEAVSELSGRRSDFRCLLVGEGPDLERMKQLAEKLCLKPGTVIFTGLKGVEELTSLYKEVDFTVLSSRYETFGTVIAESLSFGTPVLSTEVGIAPEVINERNGRLIPANESDSIAESLDRMLEVSDLFDRNGIMREIAGRFTPESIAGKLSAIYSQIQGNV